jgi:ABC-type transport system involved in multi-copper enzyme maturation permease subunit
MLKSLVWKEFRELLPISVLAIAAEMLLIGVLAAERAYRGIVRIEPRTEAEAVWPLLYIVALIYPIAAGLWQVWRENTYGNFQFLLHRPVSRNTLMGVKLICGATACALIICVPVIFFAMWIDSEVFHHQRTWITNSAVSLCFGIGLLYVSAFLSALRPARWYGSMFFPLWVGIGVYIISQILASTSTWLSESMRTTESNWLWIFALALGPTVIFCFIPAILYSANKRDYS